MSGTRAAMLRRLWLNVHLWIGIGLTVLLVPISISGALLVWHDEIDAIISPHRYAVTGAEVAQQPSVYLAKAAEAVAGQPGDLRVTGLRFPETPGWPVRVVTRAHENAAPGTRPRFVTVFLDPPTGKVLDVMEFRTSLIGFLHVFHENLTIPEYSGRQIVGWAGVGMLILSLTGIWLWWPRNGNLLRALRWTRSPRFTFNLHNMLGFWIAIPLAVVSLTGIYLSFPQTARQAMSSIAPMNPPGQRGFAGTVARQTALTPERALEAAREAVPNARPLVLFLPVEARGGRGASPAWRTQMALSEHETVTVMVDDRSGKATLAPAPQAGDRAASWIRWIHEGSHSGPVWAGIVFLTGVFPPIFAVTGIVMWLRRRAGRKRLDALRAPSLHPAE
ncbi:MAG: PepSY-associated TM helix domain-containing protein [Pseudolabrys sp.]